MAAERLDLVIFGATGFTGKYTVKQAASLAKSYQFSWGIAGRRKEGLENVLKEFDLESENIPIIIADLTDDESLTKMTEKAKVVANCCGPYRFYGEPVIKACIATKSHYVDVSGEPQFVEQMQLEYNDAAREAGVYIISSCGFDSVPCDLGIIYAQEKFKGDVNSIETYLTAWTDSNAGGAALHYGTWESAVYGLAHAGELREIRSKLFPKKLPEFTPKLTRKSVHRSTHPTGWSFPFPGADRSVALRTQRFLFEKYKQRPAQVQCYVTLKSFFHVLTAGLVFSVFATLTKFDCGRKLLLKYPRFFSAGFASHEGPKPEVMEKTHFSITFKVSGWAEKLAEPTDNHSEPPNKELIAKVTGVNPGYGATCIILLLSGITILKDAHKMPDNGGVLTPGAAFAKTSIIDELNKNGVNFEIISSIEK